MFDTVLCLLNSLVSFGTGEFWYNMTSFLKMYCYLDLQIRTARIEGLLVYNSKSLKIIKKKMFLTPWLTLFTPFVSIEGTLRVT